MYLGFIIRIFVCILIALLLSYLLVFKQNELTELRLHLPKIAREIESLEEKNSRLKYQIESFENPVHLMEIARSPEFGYLKHPLLDEIIFLPAEQSADR